MDDLDRAWRVSCRRILSLPSRTHCDLIPCLMNTLPPSQQIHQRTVNFFKEGLGNSNEFINQFFHHCLALKNSVMYRNIKHISVNYKLSISDLFHNRKFKLNKKTIICKNWKSNIIRELIYCRESQLLSNLSMQEINDIINEICIF